jgi:hypothetical protein
MGHTKMTSNQQSNPWFSFQHKTPEREGKFERVCNLQVTKTEPFGHTIVCLYTRGSPNGKSDDRQVCVLTDVSRERVYLPLKSFYSESQWP